jgi:hypothetical protein
MSNENDSLNYGYEDNSNDHVGYTPDNYCYEGEPKKHHHSDAYEYPITTTPIESVFGRTGIIEPKSSDYSKYYQLLSTTLSEFAKLILSPNSQGYLTWDGATLSISSGGQAGTGTVTSVGLSAPSNFTVTGSPITGFGTLSFSWNGPSANFLLADGSTVTTSTYALASSLANYATIASLAAYQPLDADLTAIASLGGLGLLKKTGTDTWELDNTTYLTSTSNAATASKLLSPVNINGTSFDGSASISFNTDAVSEGPTNKYFLNSRVLSTPLTGYSLGDNTTISALDTIIQAFGKIQSQINNIQPSNAILQSISNLSQSQTGLIKLTNGVASFDSNVYALTSQLSSYQPLDADLTAIAGLSGNTGILRKTAANTWSLDATTYLTGNQSISISGDATGTGSTSISLTVGKILGITVPAASTGNLRYNGSALIWDATAYLTGNQSITWTPSGDVSGSASGTTAITPALVVTGIQGKAITLATGFLKYNGTSWSFDNSSYQPLASNLTTLAALGNPSSNGYVLSSNTSGVMSWIPVVGGGGTVTSVGLSAPTLFTVSGSPITTNGTLSFAWNGSNLNFVLADGSTVSTSTYALASALSSYLTTATASSTYLTISTASTTYQPLDGDLTSIAGLSGTSGFAKKTAANTWTLDTNTYLTTNQSITWTGSGDVSGTASGATAISPSITVTGIRGKSITLASGLLRYNGTAFSFDSSSYLTANQSITLSGDVSGSGATAITVAVNKILGNSIPANATGALTNNGTGTLSWTSYLTTAPTITLTGDVTGSGTGSFATTIASSTVTGKILTGYNLGTNVSITDSDSILGAFGKIQGQLNSKANMAPGVESTGLYYWASPYISIAGNTTFNVGAAQGQIVDANTTPGAPTITQINYPGQSAITDQYVTTAASTYIYLDNTGTLRQQPTALTDSQRRANIYLGIIAHPLKTIISSVDISPDICISVMSQNRDMWRAINYINNGIMPYANGANLNINITGGKLFGLGINWANDPLSPMQRSIGPFTIATFKYRLQDGTTYANTTSINPTQYDNSSVLRSVGGGSGSSTNQRIYTTTYGVIVVHYGQTVYTNLEQAIASVGSEAFITPPDVATNLHLIGILSVNKNATNLSDPSQARFISVSKFGEISSGSSGATTATFQSIYNNSTIPQLSTNSTIGALTFHRASAADTDNVLAVTNGDGSTTLAITGNGDISASKFITNGSSSLYFVLGDGSTVLKSSYALLSSPTFTGTVTTPALTLSGFSTGVLINTSGVISALSGTNIVLANGTTIAQSTYLTANQTITLSGDVAGSGSTSITTSISAATITGKALTGYIVGTNTALAAADTILAAFGKIQAQINARGVGSVTSVGLSTPTIFTVSNSPVTGAGTLTFAWNGSSSNLVRADGSTIAASTYQTAATNLSTLAALGNPASNGYVLSSTTAGVMSWIPVSGGGGTVTSIGLSAPSIFTVSGSPVTTAGTLSFAWNGSSTNFVLGDGTTTAVSGFLTTSAASSTYQPLDADLTSIAGLAGTTGWLKKTAANTWALDTSTFLTANQSITWAGSGDISGSASGTTSISPSITVTGIQGKSITLASGLLRYNGTAFSFDSNTYLTTNQSITLSGDTSGSGTTAITVTVNKILGNTVPANASGALTNNGTGTLSWVSYLTTAPTITLTGDVTGSGTGSFATSITAATVTGKALTDYALGTNAVLDATDTILAAFGKVQAQINAKGSGTITSVALSAPSIFTVSGSPVTSSGTLRFAWNGASSNLVRADGTTVAQSTFQTANTNLTAIASLPNASGSLTNNGSGTFSYTAMLPLSGGTLTGQLVSTKLGYQVEEASISLQSIKPVIAFKATSNSVDSKIWLIDGSNLDTFQVVSGDDTQVNYLNGISFYRAPASNVLVTKIGHSGGTTTINTIGSGLVSASSGLLSVVSPPGTSGYVLSSTTAGVLSWIAPGSGGMTNPMTTTGDMIYASSGSTPARLAVGTTGQVLIGGTTPTWSSTLTLGGKLTVPASTTGSAGFSLQQGTAPTVPGNGDFWITSAGVYAQVAGSTLKLNSNGALYYSSTTSIYITNTTTAGSLGSTSLASAAMTPGNVISVQADGYVKYNTLSDTVTVTVRIAGTDVSFTVVGSSVPSGVVNTNYHWYINGRLMPSTGPGAGSSLKFFGRFVVVGTGAEYVSDITQTLTADTSSAITFDLRAQWSGTGANNSIGSEYLVVQQINSIGGGGGAVMSVALSAPSLFTVTGSPITSSGVLGFAWNGSSSNLVRADGSVVAASSYQAASTALANFAALGNPSTNGYVLSSTTAGVLSWVAGGSGGFIGTTTNGVAYYDGTALTNSSNLTYNGSYITSQGASFGVNTSLSGWAWFGSSAFGGAVNYPGFWQSHTTGELGLWAATGTQISFAEATVGNIARLNAGGLYPETDNTFSLGTSAKAWAAAYAVSGRFNNTVLGSLSTVTSGGTTTLTAASPQVIEFTGSTASHKCSLPDTTNLSIGRRFEIYNNATVPVLIQNSDLTSIITVAASSSVTVICKAQTGAVGDWIVDDKLALSGGTITGQIYGITATAAPLINVRTSYPGLDNSAIRAEAIGAGGQAIYAKSSVDNAYGIWAHAVTGINSVALYANASDGATAIKAVCDGSGYAGVFTGNVKISGTTTLNTAMTGVLQATSGVISTIDSSAFVRSDTINTFTVDQKFNANAYYGSGTLTAIPAAPLNMLASAAATMKTQLNLINTGGNAGAGACIDFYTYDVTGMTNPGMRIGALDNNYSADFVLYTKTPNSSTGELVERFRITSSGVGTLPGGLTCTTGKLGYATGAGGTVTQATSKSTRVTLNKQCGNITMHGAALANATTVTFTLTNSFITANDMVVVRHRSAGTLGAYNFAVAPAAGSCTISVRNVHTSSLSESIVLQFFVLSAVVA